jgi:integrase
MFKRGKIWYFSINGTKESSGTSDKKRAEALERQRKQEAWDRANGFYVKTWDEACEEWLSLNEHLDSYAAQCIRAAWWTERLDNRKVNAITPELVHGIIKADRPVDMKNRVKANSTANVYVRFVAKIIRSAKVTPPDFTEYPEPNGSKRWLRPEEWSAISSSMPEDLRHLSTFALATGLRKSNCMYFEWGWIHGDKAYLPKEVTKTDEDYSIPLSTVAQRVIEERRRAKVRHAKYVFTNSGEVWDRDTLLRALRKAEDASGVDHLTFHTFRHTFASWLAQRGVSDAVRRRLGCWSAGSDAASGYVHFDVESLRPFAEMVFPKQSHPSGQVLETTAEKVG